VDGRLIQDAFERGAAYALVQKDFSDKYPQLDYGLIGNPENIKVLGMSPLCLRVEDSLKPSIESHVTGESN